uniref:Uncharacterized protein n=1 Tax=Eutreptiella gymnastica TaxID=73025 RepID=A0A7S4FT89_9EUGL
MDPPLKHHVLNHDVVDGSVRPTKGAPNRGGMTAYTLTNQSHRRKGRALGMYGRKKGLLEGREELPPTANGCCRAFVLRQTAGLPCRNAMALVVFSAKDGLRVSVAGFG